MILGWLLISLYHGYGANSAMRGDLAQLQLQTQQLNQQVATDRAELRAARSAGSLQERERAQGLVAPGESTYIVESPQQAAGPVPAEQGVQIAGQVAQQFQQFLEPAAASPPSHS